MKVVDINKLIDQFAESGIALPRRGSSHPNDHQHLDDPTIWSLAAYDGGGLSLQTRAKWNELLSCSECYNRLVSFRLAITSETVLSTEFSQFDHFWEIVKVAKARVLLTWIGFQLVVASTEGITSGSTRRSVRVRGGHSPSGQASTIETKFGLYNLRLRFEAETADTKSWALYVQASPSHELKCRLHSPQRAAQELVFDERGMTTLHGLEDANYKVEIIGSHSQLVGVIDLVFRSDTGPAPRI